MTPIAQQPDRLPDRPPIVAVVAFDGISPFHLSVPCIVFGDDYSAGGLPRFDLRVCAVAPGVLRTTAGFTIDAAHGLDAIDAADIVIVPSVADIAGLNSVLKPILTNAAAAICGMVGQGVRAESGTRRTAALTGRPRGGSLVHPDAGAADQPFEALHVVADAPLEGLGRAADGLDAEGVQAAAHTLVAQRGVHRLVQRADDGGRHAGGPEHAPPDAGVEARQAGFRHGRQVGQPGQPLRRR